MILYDNYCCKQQKNFCKINPCCRQYCNPCVLPVIFPPLPPFPTPPARVDSIQLQLQDSTGGEVLNNANVIFDTVILNTSSTISYNDTTGNLTINSPGKYLVHWWINVDGAEEQTTVVFSAEIGATAISASSLSPITTLQLYGQGLFEVGSVPVTFSLVNRSGSTVGLGSSLIQADLVLHKL